MRPDLTDEETLALLNILTETIENTAERPAGSSPCLVSDRKKEGCQPCPGTSRGPSQSRA